MLDWRLSFVDTQQRWCAQGLRSGSLDTVGNEPVGFRFETVGARPPRVPRGLTMCSAFSLVLPRHLLLETRAPASLAVPPRVERPAAFACSWPSCAVKRSLGASRGAEFVKSRRREGRAATSNGTWPEVTMESSVLKKTEMHLPLKEKVTVDGLNKEGSVRQGLEACGRLLLDSLSLSCKPVLCCSFTPSLKRWS